MKAIFCHFNIKHSFSPLPFLRHTQHMNLFLCNYPPPPPPPAPSLSAIIMLFSMNPV